MATKRSRALRSTTLRDSVDSGVELEMKKSRHQLDVVVEKADDQAVKATDTAPTSTRTVEQARRKTNENKENVVENGQVTADASKPMSAEKECVDDEDVDIKQLTSANTSAPANVDSNSVFTYVSSFHCFEFLLLSKIFLLSVNLYTGNCVGFCKPLCKLQHSSVIKFLLSVTLQLVNASVMLIFDS